MRRLVFLLLITAALAGSSIAQSAADKQACRKHLAEAHKLVRELDGFKYRSSFRLYGFGSASPHHQWLLRANALHDAMASDKGWIRAVKSGEAMISGPDIPLLGLTVMRCVTRGQCDDQQINFILDHLNGLKCKQ